MRRKVGALEFSSVKIAPRKTILLKCYLLIKCYIGLLCDENEVHLICDLSFDEFYLVFVCVCAGVRKRNRFNIDPDVKKKKKTGYKKCVKHL